MFYVDRDDLRNIVNNKDYSKDGRYNNIKTAQSISLFFDSKGYDIVVSLMFLYRELREQLKT